MKHFIFTKFFALLCMCTTLYACQKEEIYIGHSPEANLVVANITSGEQIENNGIQFGTITKMIAHPGDVLRISYYKPEDFEKYTWEVTIDILGELRTGEAPFTTEYTIKETDEGERSITCKGVIKDKDVEFSGEDYGIVYIQVVNESL